MSTLTERLRNSVHLDAVLDEVVDERRRQDDKFGPQWRHPDGTGAASLRFAANVARSDCDAAFRGNRGTWRHILDEEVAEAMAESDPVKLRAELVQVAAVAAAWIQALDRRLDNNDPAAAA